MKRDMELIRQIMLQAEAHPGGKWPEIKIDGRTEDEIGYHCGLIIQAGFADGVDITSLSDASPNWSIHSLTWEGHEFLDASRDPDRWARAKKISSAIGGMAVSTLKGLLADLADAAAKKLLGNTD